MNQKNSRLLPWIIWGLAAAFVVFNYIQQIVPDVIGPALSQAVKANDSTLGDIAAAFFYAYAVMQIPVGLIFDRWGTRWPLVIAIAVAGAASVAFSMTGSAGGALATRLIMGLGSAFSFIGCLKLVQEWFPPSQFSTLAGFTNTAGMIGASAAAPLAWLVDQCGWRVALGGIGVAQLILAALVLILVRDRVATNAPSPAEKETTPWRENFSALLKNPQAWLNAVYATCISLVFVAFGGLWGGAYIEKAYRLNAEAAAAVGSLLFIGGIVGSIFFGWWSDFLRRRKLPMLVAGVGALVAMAGMLYIPGLPLLGFQIGLFAVGFFSSANIVSYAVAHDLFPKLAGLSIGFLSTCYYAGSASSQPLVGLLLQQKSANTSTLTAADYGYAFAPLVLFMALGLLAALLMKETLKGENKTTGA